MTSYRNVSVHITFTGGGCDRLRVGRRRFSRAYLRHCVVLASGRIFDRQHYTHSTECATSRHALSCAKCVLYSPNKMHPFVPGKDVTMHEYTESDAAIVLHLFATYLDRVAPPHSIHRKKAFTSTGIYFEGVGEFSFHCLLLRCLLSRHC